MTHYLKERCAGCGRTKFRVTKEHLFPKWLIIRTKTDKTRIRWINNKHITASKCTIPLCERCNYDFGEKLEKPVSKIFTHLEEGKGISETEAELLIRWLWKITGLFWVWMHPKGRYTQIYSVRERVLRPIDKIRQNLVLGISLIQNIDPEYGDLPMGIDSTNEIDAIFASGVFSKIALMVSLNIFEKYIPDCFFTKIHLHRKPNPAPEAKLFYPKTGFKDDTEAVHYTKVISDILSIKHDELALKLLIKNKTK